MIIRYATLADVTTLVDFQLKMALETENITLSIEKLTTGIQAVLHDETKGNYMLAELDQQPVACLMITYEWSDWRNATVWWIQSVYVSASHRGQGIYTKLYAHIRSLVEKDSNVCGIRLYVEKQNKAAQSVYKKVGMMDEHYQLFEWMK